MTVAKCSDCGLDYPVESLFYATKEGMPVHYCLLCLEANHPGISEWGKTTEPPQRPRWIWRMLIFLFWWVVTYILCGGVYYWWVGKWPGSPEMWLLMYPSSLSMLFYGRWMPERWQ